MVKKTKKIADEKKCQKKIMKNFPFPLSANNMAKGMISGANSLIQNYGQNFETFDKAAEEKIATDGSHGFNDWLKILESGMNDDLK